MKNEKGKRKKEKVAVKKGFTLKLSWRGARLPQQILKWVSFTWRERNESDAERQGSERGESGVRISRGLAHPLLPPSLKERLREGKKGGEKYSRGKNLGFTCLDKSVIKRKYSG